MPTKRVRPAYIFLITVLSLFQATGTAGALVADDSVGSRQIINRAVKADDIAKGAIRAAKIANGAVTTAKIKDGAVTSAKIANGTIVDADIAAGAAIAASKINAAGLNADLLDGKHAADFVQTAGDQSISGNLTVAGLNYSAPKTGVISVPASAFVANETTTAIVRDYMQIYATGSEINFLVAPLNLPQGAIITKLTYHFKDVAPAYSTTVSLIKTRVKGAIRYVSYMAQIRSDDTTTSWHTLTNDSIEYNEPVDNDIYGYQILAWLYGGAGSATVLSKVDVTYTYSSP